MSTLNVAMTLTAAEFERMFLFCFWFGAALSVLSVFAAGLHLHLPKLHFGHFQHFSAKALAEASYLSFPSIVAFVAWFGGAGYLSIHYQVLGMAASVLISLFAGLMGMVLVASFLRKMMSFEQPLDSHDFRMEGVIGTLSVAIREKGTGELVYEQAGTRRVCAARAEPLQVIPRGVEVLVARYEAGIAYVRPWHEVAEMHQVASDAP